MYTTTIKGKHTVNVPSYVLTQKHRLLHIGYSLFNWSTLVVDQTNILYYMKVIHNDKCMKIDEMV